MLLFFTITALQVFSCYPHHSLLRQSSKVKSLLFPKIPSQNLFNIYLMTCMNEKASCMESLVINFAPNIINVLIVFTLQGQMSKLAWSKWMIWHSHCKYSFLNTGVPSPANCQGNSESIFSIKWFWHQRGWVLFSDHLLNWRRCTVILLFRNKELLL